MLLGGMGIDALLSLVELAVPLVLELFAQVCRGVACVSGDLTFRSYFVSPVGDEVPLVPRPILFTCCLVVAHPGSTRYLYRQADA